ncbi:MAG: bifunctional [glutamate--ammonia ligase]-adenylyl-L-tyrosine phosphorylase/[glutamate--ammonia-ligase] adenylyltransferase [Proteobacteria bacterium]|nr:bifunctional [glutamate--ammonia ligase]-adenylyl-L-tyrosine phosphorylase/[glutamate--ammonia-ligase] adenylyltransferase [Pseudomonadota bacterium]
MDATPTDPLPRLLAQRRQALAPQLARTPLPEEPVDALLLASDFAFGVLRDEPDAITAMLGTPSPPPVLDPAQPTRWPAQLRRWRKRESLRLIWRDITGQDDVDATLAGASALADAALEAALAAVEAHVAAAHGVIGGADGNPQRMVVFGLGKLGGGELNFSSDVDLVFAYERGGSSDGARALDADAYYARIGQRLIGLLDEVTAEGFCHRVDMRLRPFGSVGRLALSFDAMEQYYQAQGRDWERYAWIKARPVAGDIAAGQRLLTTLRPFVYRRYLDYTALDGLREMKAAIAADERRELTDHLKLGPGGIREIEFLVQALQLIRGGREPALRNRSLLPALAALAAGGHLPEATAAALAGAYRFLRRLENRVQMFADQQVHALPDDPLIARRIALGLGYADVTAMRTELDAQRAVVSAEFERLLAARKRGTSSPNALQDYWLALPDGGSAQALVDAGFSRADSHDAALRDFARAPAIRALSRRSRPRLDRVLPRLLREAGQTDAADLALPRLLDLLHAIARRGSYLALLDEQPAAASRLVEVAARSALLSERIAAHPLLLDELLDVRAEAAPPTLDGLRSECTHTLSACAEDDVEARLHALTEFRQGVAFRIGLALLRQRVAAGKAAIHLAELAQVVLDAALALARRALRRDADSDDGLAVIGYGSIGGQELGFMSDLDLVFLHAAGDDHEQARANAKLAQKLVSLLGTPTPAGALYEVDVRLRPDGAKGLLVAGLDSFADYQRQRAWTWEHQALVRARGLTGAAATLARFAAIRAQILAQPRDTTMLRSDVLAMRARMRAALDRSDARRFDLKQGEGGLVDLEFLLQYLVLAHGHAHPALLHATRTDGLIATLASAEIVSAAQAATLASAHAHLLRRALECTLDRRPRMIVMDAPTQAACASVRAACATHGLEFAALAPSA